VAAGAGVPLAFDAGSGLLDRRVPWLEGPAPGWLVDEPGVVQALAAGADLVMFSGDKLLGGPQAGIVVGDAALVDEIRRHPVARAMRIAGPELAALAVTLEHYADGAAGRLPLWAMASLPAEALRRRCEAVLARSGVAGVIAEGRATMGAGSVPGSEIPGPVIVVADHADEVHLALLRGSDTPVVTRREEGTVRVDLRSVDPADDETVAAALARACRS